MHVTRVSDELNAPDELDEVKHLEEVVLSYLLVDLSALPSRIADGPKRYKLPHAQYEQPKTENDEQRNIREQNGLVL
jgi:hypothetical protein